MKLNRVRAKKAQQQLEEATFQVAKVRQMLRHSGYDDILCPSTTNVDIEVSGSKF